MRRVIIGTSGELPILYDGPPQSINHITNTHADSLVMANVPEFVEPVPSGECCTADIWETDGLPTSDAPDRVGAPQEFSLEPPGTGFRIRYQSWGPNLYASMHSTNTLDVDFVISGYVDLMLEGDHTIRLNAGDSVVIRGTKHAWRAGPDGVKLLIYMQKLA